MRKLIFSVLMLAVLAPAVPAEARGWRVHVGGGVHTGGGFRYGGGYRAPRVYVHGGARVRYWSPRIWRPTWYWAWWRPYWRTYVYYDTPSYGYAPCCAVEGGAVVGTTVVRPPDEPNVGVGIRGSATSFGEDRPRAEGIGGVLRFRVSSVELELEVAHDRYTQDLARRDTRVGTALYVPLFGTTLQPYVVGGLGLNFVDYNDGLDPRTQGYLAGGGGLALNFSRSFTLSADVRYVVRHFFDDNPNADIQTAKTFAPVPPMGSSDADRRESGVEGRVSAIFYF
jgi:hypothetical protein